MVLKNVVGGFVKVFIALSLSEKTTSIPCFVVTYVTLKLAHSLVHHLSLSLTHTHSFSLSQTLILLRTSRLAPPLRRTLTHTHTHAVSLSLLTSTPTRWPSRTPEVNKTSRWRYNQEKHWLGNGYQPNYANPGLSVNVCLFEKTICEISYATKTLNLFFYPVSSSLMIGQVRTWRRSENLSYNRSPQSVTADRNHSLC